MSKYIIALDQGTTSSRALLFDRDMKIRGMVQKEFTQIYPAPGYVEHDPIEIFSSTYGVLNELIISSGIDIREVAAIGITNQRETAIVWDKATGQPVYNAIVWQCRRTAAFCDELAKKEIANYIRENTGLLIDAYFSASKIKWILDNVTGANGESLYDRAERGEIIFGTVDTYLLWKLTGGKVHATDYTNASRTMLFNIHSKEWDDTLLSEFGIPHAMLPEIKPSGSFYGVTDKKLLGAEIPICGIAGDQQASLFGQGSFSPGDVKNTYGTGCFMLMNIGSELKQPAPLNVNNTRFGNTELNLSTKSEGDFGLLRTVCAGLDGEYSYAIEGSVFTGGALIKWLRDEMKLIYDASDTEYFASKANDNGGVYIVPAFTGLGAPYWDMYARGTIIGLTRGTNRNNIIRAALEAIAYQSYDVMEAMTADTGVKLNSLKVDGGACANNFLMQFQADISGIKVFRPETLETTALGAAALAGLTVGFYRSKNEIPEKQHIERTFSPEMNENERTKLIKMWRRAVAHSRLWLDESF